MFQMLQIKEDTPKLNPREIAELLFDLEKGLDKLDLPNWGVVERILERHVRGKDAFIVPELVTSWGIDREKEPELFFSCVTNLRTLAGYKDIPFKVDKLKDK